MLPVLRRHGWAPGVSDRPIHRLDTWFDRVFDDVDRFLAPGAVATVAHAFDVVPLSVWEDEDHVHVEAELPGVAREDIEVTLHNGRLFIKGERKPAEGRRYLHNSRMYGRFERFLTLPETAGSDNVQASMADGILRLTLPKRFEAKPRRIEIQPNA